MDSIEFENLSPEVLNYINALQKENADLKDKVQKQDIRISNLTEMLVTPSIKCRCIIITRRAPERSLSRSSVITPGTCRQTDIPRTMPQFTQQE